MQIYLAHPVRKIDPDYEYWLRLIVEKLEASGHRVYFPLRDTPQHSDELTICKTNLDAIAACDCVALVWDGLSQGVLFDMGIAFALGLPLTIIKIPAPTPKKSFQNMFIQWQSENPGVLVDIHDENL